MICTLPRIHPMPESIVAEMTKAVKGRKWMRQAFPAHASCGVAGLAWYDGSHVYRAVALLALAF